MTEIADARLALHATLVTWTADVLEPERVHLYTPEQVVSPCIWIAQPGVGVVQSGTTRLRQITFGVAIVADGVLPSQCALLDELVARVSDAIQAHPHADDAGAQPEQLDIGGMLTRAVVYEVAITTYARSFCTRVPNPPLPLTDQIPFQQEAMNHG